MKPLMKDGLFWTLLALTVITHVFFNYVEPHL